MASKITTLNPASVNPKTEFHRERAYLPCTSDGFQLTPGKLTNSKPL